MRISIEGMHCQACVARVQRAIEKIEGIRVERIDIGSAELIAEPAHQPAVLEAIRRAGYEPHIASQ